MKDPATYEKDEKFKTVSLTEPGSEQVEDMLQEAGVLTEGNLYDIFNVSVVHHVQQSVRAHTLFARDVDYIVRDDQVIIIDEFTGRMMQGRRYSEGLHQALEAKEHVTVQAENQTLASITFQNYFRLYPKLAGMTGTAMTEADEFAEIYKLDVVEIPTNVPVHPQGRGRRGLSHRRREIRGRRGADRRGARQGPAGAGRHDLDREERNDQRPAEEEKGAARGAERPLPRAGSRDRSQAGAPGAVTIATNMAGRGTDIKLGGNLDVRLRKELADVHDDAAREAREAQIREEMAAAHEKVKEAGGLFVIGTERHESRRIDNQLRGRSGRQGDPGGSRFFLSLEDDLMRIFGSDRMGGMLQRLGLKEGEAIVHPWINKALEKAQKKVEARNFDTRKNVLKYDDVMNDQRKEVYAQRKEFMKLTDVAETVADMRSDVIGADGRRPRAGEGLRGAMGPRRSWRRRAARLQHRPADRGMGQGRRHRRDASARAHRAGRGRDDGGEGRQYGPGLMRFIEKSLLMQTLDAVWKEHLYALDHLRQGIGLRAYGQRDPLNEYKSEAFALFNAMLAELKERVTSMLARVELAPERPMSPPPMMRMVESHADPGSALSSDLALAEPVAAPRIFTAAPNRTPAVDPNDESTWAATSRNAPCPCGSGKKYKHCHGRLA